ncbi:DUF1439 domain-containing protein [Motilimonas cestriensis]|uniref:DUF1439 domain-containing protein n=1 Tax=Motilimonas cestriensis TaxID=2742685 RepID=A0ABS8WE76_9GAMM|nr:DUF1439 domain-containing protein [Motilimonas cestriensis]MCE2595998.1 DUF1439 domain-containing protein [Motilimonas cestriensis]
MAWINVKKGMVVGLALLASACSQTYSVSEQEVASYINEQVSFKHEDGIPGILYVKAELGKVAVKFGREQADALQVSGTSSLELQNPLRPFKGSVTVDFSAKPWYNKKEGAVYLKDVKLTNVSSDPADLGNEVAKLVPRVSQALQLFLQTQPIYVLDEQDMNQAMIKKVGKEIVIKPGKIEFVMGL